MKRLFSIIIAALMLLSLAACKSSEQPPAAEPTQAAQTTEAPAEEPTAEPAEEPTEAPAEQVYNESDAAKLRAFLELADESGVKNGSKLFPNYDPDDPAAWTGADFSLEWNEEGRLTAVLFSSSAVYPDTVALAGALELNDIPELEVIKTGNEVQLESIKVTSCPKLAEVHIYGPVTGMAQFDCSLPENGFYVCGSFVQTSFGPGGYGICIVAEPGGKVCYNYNNSDTHGNKVHKIEAVPDPGMALVGWYPEDGGLYSTEQMLDVTEAVPPLGNDFVLTAMFAEESAPFFDFYQGEAPRASEILAEVEPGKPVEADLDFDGKPDTVELVDEGEIELYPGCRTYAVYVTMGSDPENRIKLDEFTKVESCALRVLDCNMDDERLELLFNAYAAELTEFVTAWRLNDHGEFDAFPIERVAELETDGTYWDAHGYFDATKGIPISTRTEIFDTQYIPARFTITEEGFKLLGPFEFWDPTVPGHHGYRELKREMKVTKLVDGSPAEEVTLAAGTMFAPITTDLWSWVNIVLEDGSVYRLNVEVRGGEVFIDGLQQEEYCEIWVAE